MKITPIIKYPDKFKGAKLTLSPIELLLICGALRVYSEDPKVNAFDRDQAKDLRQKIMAALEKAKGENSNDRNNPL